MNKKHRKKHLLKRKSDRLAMDGDFEAGGIELDGEVDEHAVRRLRRRRRLRSNWGRDSGIRGGD